MTTEEKSDIMYALELGLDAIILERDIWIEKYGESSYRPHVLAGLNGDIELVEKAQEIMRLSK